MKLCPRCDESYPDDAGFCPFDAQALVRSTDPLIGRTLAARYRLVRRLGSGGMAVVYLARHVMIDRLSAIKILRQDLGMNPAHRERFLREARAVNRINHPNIVEITDFGEDGPLVFLVMEYVEGESLLAAVERGPIDCKRALGLGLQIASALARAHELGVIHRDLKPENVLLFVRDHLEVVKLTDFGIAKIVDAPALTFSEQRFGTPGYIAPEYIEGSPASPRGDLYAFGVLLYEMLTATLPFDARFPAELLALQLRGSPVAPSSRCEGIPPAVEALVLRLIARRPDDRPRDAFAVLDALHEEFDRVSAPWTSLSPPASETPPTVRLEGGSGAISRAVPSHGIPARWEASLADLELRLEDTRRLRGNADARVLDARELLDAALGLHASLERAGAAVAGHQGTVDDLEDRGREFRATLGRAIDTLSRDRSREQARIDALVERRLGIFAGLAVAGLAQPQREALRSEGASVSAQERVAQAVDADLAFQLATLQRQLHARNEQMERALAEATGKLEGALSAARRITQEIARTRDEAIRLLG
jgi:eukaryotic-like serine/threonine-protein kinase